MRQRLIKIIKSNRRRYTSNGQIIINNCIDYIGEINWKESQELFNLTGRETRQYYLRFLKQKDIRVNYLQQYLKEHNFDFELDYTEESIKDLWAWQRDVKKSIDKSVEKDSKDEEKLYEILAKIRIDIAIYFGETLIHNYPQLKWDYIKGPKSSADYHKLVIIGFRYMEYLIPTEEVWKCDRDESFRNMESNLFNYYEWWKENV